MEATASGLINDNSAQNLLKEFLKYLISPAVTVGLVWLILRKVYNFGKISKEFEGAVSDLKDLKKKFNNVIINVSVIKTHLVDKRGMDANLFVAMSPIKFTETGSKLIKQAGFDQIYQDI